MLQDILVEKDFTMVAAEPIIKNFSASVTENILEIRLYWAGKGTTRIPATGVYGPLISAISVDPSELILPIIIIVIVILLLLLVVILPLP
jgi:hypothetical protein